METTKEKIYVVVWESNVDGETIIEVTPCRTLEAAKKEMEDTIDLIHMQGHFKDVDMDDCSCSIDSRGCRYLIIDNTDDYWEDIRICCEDLIG